MEQAFKSFGATKALSGATLRIRAGEIHAIVGENGSGKSTAVKVLSGVHQPDSGAVSISGHALGHRFSAPRHALAAGIATVFQEILVVGARSVLENVWLGQDGLVRPDKSEAERREEARRVLDTLLDEPLALDTPVEALPLSDQQVVCVARALLRNPQVLILDEATSALDVDARRKLFGVLRQLTQQGKSVIFISHRMDEIDEIADRVTVMRNGQTVATLSAAEAEVEELVRLMTGAQHLVDDRVQELTRAAAPGAVALRTQDVQLRSDAAAINVTVRRGEIVGLGGLEGQGQSRFLRVLRGEPSTGSVLREEGNSPGRVSSPRDAARRGIAYVPRDRRLQSVFDSLAVLDNFSLPTIGRDRRFGLLSTRRTKRRFHPFAEELAIKYGSSDAPISTLSGGNQQKVVMARWLASDPDVLLLDDPTRGVDLNAKRDFYSLIARLAAQGTAIVLLSSEVDELIELTDRVLVFREDQVFCEIQRKDLSREALVAAFFGKEVASA